LIAIKFERSDTQRPQLPIEKYVFEIMSKNLYIPTMFYFGSHNDYTVLAMDLLGPSVEDLLNFSGRKFSSKTICMIIEQILRGIEALHNHSLIHRDLKPDSKFRKMKIFIWMFFFQIDFLFGLGRKSHIVHLIDFGLCKNYRHPLTYEHIPYRIGKTLTGTYMYNSLIRYELTNLGGCRCGCVGGRARRVHLFWTRTRTRFIKILGPGPGPGLLNFFGPGPGPD
jgi:serine/threonine protein kinase